MVKKTFFLSLYKVLQGYNYGCKLNHDVVKVGMALAKMIAHIVIKTHWCFLVIFLGYEHTTKLRRVLLRFKLYFTFETFEPLSQPYFDVYIHI